MRTRITTTDQQQTLKIRILDNLTGSDAVSESLQGSTSAATDIMADTVTDNWTKRRANGEIIVNSMVHATSMMSSSMSLSYTLRKFSYPDMTIQSSSSVSVLSGATGRLRLPGKTIATRWFESGDAHDQMLADFDISSAIAVESATLARCLSRAASSDALALVTFAELNKTLGIFHDVAKQAVAFHKVITRMTDVDKKFLRKANLRDMKRSGLIAAQAWLAYRYGLMSAYYDIMSWVDAKHKIGRPRRARFASQTATEYDSGPQISSSAGTWSTETVVKRFKRYTTTSAGCIVGFDLDGSMAENYGVLNLLSTGWELIPYSFVLDWFVDVGERLAALEGKFLRPVLGSWITHRHTLYEYSTFDGEGRSYNDGLFHYNSLGLIDSSSKTDTCQVVVRSANPSLSALPQLKVNLNWRRLADSVALIALASKKAKALGHKGYR